MMRFRTVPLRTEIPSTHDESCIKIGFVLKRPHPLSLLQRRNCDRAQTRCCTFQMFLYFQRQRAVDCEAYGHKIFFQFA